VIEKAGIDIGKNKTMFGVPGYFLPKYAGALGFSAKIKCRHRATPKKVKPSVVETEGFINPETVYGLFI
jgi:hypothetical protein